MNNYIDKKIEIKNLQKDEESFDLFLLENNEKQISQICDFFNSKEQILSVSGFCGVGKSCIVDFICQNFNSDVLVLKYHCLETTTLDDMFLAFFEIFKSYTIQGKIPIIKTRSENFSQKINSYFTAVKNPMVIILDSFEVLLKNNRNSIIAFLKTLSEISNIKIIITSRKLVLEYFEQENIINIGILALSQSIFEKFLRANGIKQIGVLSNELYSLTKGYWGYVKMSVNLINLNNLPIGNFLEKYSTSLMTFPEFIYREALLLVDPICIHLFRILTLMRIPLHVNLLKSLHLYEEPKIAFYVNMGLLVRENDYIYLKDYLRTIVENQLPESVIPKLHNACIELYETQLPLKPLERDLKLSRQTMRNEIEYHKMFLPRKPMLNLKELQVQDGIPIVKNETVPVSVPIVENIPKQTEETKEEKIKKISFIIEDEAILDNIAESIKFFVEDNDNKNKLAQENSKLSLTQILNLAKQQEQNKNYEEVIMLYQSALTKKDDGNFYRFLPNIYLYLANVYKKISKWYEALECYIQAQDFYYNADNFEKVNEIKFETANIYYIIYKHDNARYILEDLEKADSLSNELRIKVYLALAKLSNNINKEYSYYKKSLSLVDINVNKSIVAELYYKFAAINDEKNETNIAVQFYKKCIVSDSDAETNRFLTSAYVNLGEIYYESDYNEPAIKYFSDAMNTEKNPANLFDISMRIAEVYSIIDKNKVFEYLTKALDWAEKSCEKVCIFQGYYALADYHFNDKKYTLALKYYLNAKKYSPDNEKLKSIDNKIETIKLRIMAEEFEKILRENE